MRVVINAQLDPQNAGGIAQVLVGLAHGFAQLAGEEEYVFVCTRESAEWLRPYASGRLRLVVNDRRTPAPQRGPRDSDGFFETFEPDVLHFPYQSYTRTDIPTVFNPHDLQHVHLPEWFQQEERERREALLGDGCRAADAVIVASEWVRQDVIQHYQVDPERIHAIEWGAPTTAYDRPSESECKVVLARYGLAPGYALYPAQTWPHKNHARLIDALALLRSRDRVDVPLVCTGAQTDHAESLKARVVQRNVADSVMFVGRVEDRELVALYRGARMVVVPTLFEAVSFPIYEAFAEGVPVVCSNVTSLPDQVGDAAMLFDPRSVEGMAGAIRRVYENAPLREILITRGRKRMAQLSWTRTAESYRAVYRSLARRRASACAR